MKLRNCVFAASVLMSASLAQAAGLAVGDEAPDFTLPGSDGQTYTLSDYRGKQAVVIAWFPRAYGVLHRLGFANRETIYIGKDGRVLKIDDQVRPATSAEDMAATLGELGVARR